MGLRIYDDILEYVRRMRPVVKAIEKHDADLARQLRRALASMLLNTAEGAKQRGGKGRNRFDDAMGSTDETRAAHQFADAIGYVKADPRRLPHRDSAFSTLAIRMAWAPPSAVPPPLPRRVGVPDGPPPHEIA